jgi:glycosyltransferase involved in cell wall biosynthesis
MLAPEPFFEPRGTPFSEYHRIKALAELGHHVDLITYPIGCDVELPNLRIFRSLRPPWVRRVPIGPSLTKLVLDGLMLLTIARRILAEPYDAIHSHEEMGLIGVWVARLKGLPHLYDMHSSLPQQLANFRYSRSRVLKWLFRRVEHRMVTGSDVVVTICQELQETVVKMGAGEKSLLIENVMGGDVDPSTSLTPASIRTGWGIPEGSPIVLYTGTFEPYQGVELLIDAAGRLAASYPDARVLVVGGEPPQVERMRALAAQVGARHTVVFTGQQPPADIPAFVETGDVLVSPRIQGTNTPLKIYSYLRSGRPIVATNLRTHTQVLSSDVARLVPAEAGALAAAMGELLNDPEERARLGNAARQLARERYSRESFVERTAEAYARLMGTGADGLAPAAAGHTARRELARR